MRLRKILKLIKSSDSIKTIHRKLCGKRINSGLYRDVYELKDNPLYVVKIEHSPGKCGFANASEWVNYIQHKDWKGFGEYLVPCEAISETGQWMIQRRIKHRESEEYPKKIPSFFTDTKYTNFGWIGDRFVCCDYPHLIMGIPLRMKLAKWWDVDHAGRKI